MMEDKMLLEHRQQVAQLINESITNRLCQQNTDHEPRTKETGVYKSNALSQTELNIDENKGKSLNLDISSENLGKFTDSVYPQGHSSPTVAAKPSDIPSYCL